MGLMKDLTEWTMQEINYRSFDDKGKLKCHRKLYNKKKTQELSFFIFVIHILCPSMKRPFQVQWSTGRGRTMARHLRRGKNGLHLPRVLKREDIELALQTK